MKKHFLTLASMALLTACGGGTNNNNNSNDTTTTETPPLRQPLQPPLNPIFPIGKTKKG